MRKLTQLASAALDRIQLRLTRARPGSVLILVVVLVVLLALIGTATLSTTQADRYTAVQNSANTQTDLILEGIVQMAQATVLGDLYGTVGAALEYRPDDPTATSGYENWDAVLNLDPKNPPATTPDQVARINLLKLANDEWLSPRLPDTYPASATQPYPMWPSLGKLPGFANFDTPFTMKLRAGTGNNGISLTDLAIPTVYSERYSYTPPSGDPVWLIPNSVLPYGSSGQSFPAFLVKDPRGISGGRYIVAGDTDSDGQADSALFRIPIGEIDGVTYYGAVRIIDNNSAVNINTAWSRTSDFNFTGVAVDPLGAAIGNTQNENGLGMFPSHVGLMEMMATPAAEMVALDGYRRNSVAVTANPIADSGVGTLATATPRSDFTFTTQGELQAQQLASRTGNPGVVSGATRFQALGVSESTSMAYHFTLQNRDASRSALEALLQNAVGPAGFDSVYSSAGNFDANVNVPAALNSNRLAYSTGSLGFSRWFDDNFFYDSTGTSVSIPFPGGGGNAIFNRPLSYKRPIRALLTADNPLSNQAPFKTLPAALPAAGTAGTIVLSGMANYRTVSGPKGPIPKTNVNSAPFEELWRAYWCVMSENPTTTGTPFTVQDNPVADTAYKGMDFAVKGSPGTNPPVPATPGNTENTQRMFRSSVRDPGNPTTYYLKSNDMVLLRSAIAAVQTLQLRDPKLNDLTAPAVHKSIKLPMQGAPSGDSDAIITVFGTKPQPFITEVFGWTDISPNHKGPTGGGSNVVPYVAVELYNPYPFPIPLDQRYRVAVGNRSSMPFSNWPGTPYAPTTIYTFDGSKSIPANGYMILDNSNGVSYIPASARLGGGVPGSVERIAISNLDQILSGELLIIRDEEAATTDPTKMVPIDSYDFTGLIDGSTNKFYAWHYARPCGDEKRWMCVYPGRYWGNQGKLRQQGTDWTEWSDDPAGNIPEQSPWDLEPEDATVVLAPPTFGLINAKGTFPGSPPIQLSNLDFGGPNKPVPGSNNKYPFGGFMRNGDILQVPFIAAYTITTSTGVLVDFNSVSMDSSFAEDTDAADDFPDYAAGALPAYPDVRESIGRFAPVVVATSSTNFTHDDLDPSGTYATGAGIKWRYHWAARLLDYLTVQSPDSDYLPNAPNPTTGDPDGYQAVTGAAPVPVDNDGDGKAGAQLSPMNPLAPPADYNNEANATIQGLININTAPWKVLAAIPWVPAGTTNKFGFDDNLKTFTVGSDPKNRDDNEDIARAIVYWRDGNALASGDVLPQGPFTSLYDLYRVRVPVSLSEPGVFVFDAVQKAMMNAGDPGNAQGDFSPRNGNPMASGDTKDHARFDFEEQYMLLTKVGNLLTTRSDSFTVYIQVQGWRGVGTIKPELVVQRRTSFIIDRSKITREGGSADVINVPNE